MINTKMIVIGVLFFLVANPRTYKLVNTLLSQVGLKGMIFSGGSVSQTGVVIHAAVFTMLFCFLFSCFSVIEEGFVEGAEADKKDDIKKDDIKKDDIKKDNIKKADDSKICKDALTKVQMIADIKKMLIKL